MKKIGNVNKYIYNNKDNSSQTDPIRAKLRNLWKFNADKLELDSSIIGNYYRRTEDGNEFLLLPESLLYRSAPAQVAIAGVTQVNPNPSPVLIYDTNKEYYDFTFDLNSPYLIRPDIVNDIVQTSLTTKLEIKKTNNYLNFDYENTFNSEDINEANLLNYYMLKAKDIRNNNDIEQIITNGSKVDDSQINENQIQNYLTQISYTFNGWKDKFNKLYAGKLTKIFFNADDLKNTREYKDLVPKYVQIDFYKQPSGYFYSALKETFLDLNLFSNSIKGNATQDFLLNRTYLTNVNDLITVQSTNAAETLQFFDYDSWLNSVLEKPESLDSVNYFNFDTPADILYIGSKQKNQIPNYKDNSFLLSIMATVLLGKTNTITEENGRNYKDIISGKHAYNEPIIIKIEKINENNVLLQTYYFQNDSEDLFTFIDSQIKTDKQYKYNFSFMTVVIGSKYKYGEPSIKKSGIAAVPVEYVKPVVYIYDIPLNRNDSFEVPIDVLVPTVNPPTVPVVLPVPYKDIKNQIKLIFQRTIDSYQDIPVILEEGDTALYDKYEKVNGKILFSSADEIVNTEEFLNKSKIYYQIFRIDKPPRSYEDFYDKLYKTVEGDTFIEELEYNKKYYYAFRELIRYPKSGILKSNPTVVYQMEIINNSGIYYPIIKPYDFVKDSGVEKARSLKKYILLEASYPQTLSGYGQDLRVLAPISFGIRAFS